MFKEFLKIMNYIIAEVGAVGVHKKYLNQRTNFNRHIKTIQAIQKMKMFKGLDFGSGLCSCLVIGKLLKLDISGLDIPNTPYLPVQKKLISMGHKIHIMDTTQFPWTDFKDDEFEFITFFYSINKQFLNNEKWSMEDRLKELSRITKKDGAWFIYPSRHLNLFNRYPKLVKNINIHKWLK